MRSPTAALLWEIWRQHRAPAVAIAGLTVVVRLIGGDLESSPLVTLLAMTAFLLLFGAFNYTESGGNRGIGRFPRRLFTLPVTSLRLVAVPLLAGIASIELLYLLWMGPLSGGGMTSTPFVAILLAAFMVLYMCAIWTLERAGSLRLVMLGALAIAVFIVGLLPSFPPAPPPLWRSEAALAGIVAALALVAFLVAWRHVARLRYGGERAARRGESRFGGIASSAPASRRPFASAAAAHVWFEWRSSGMALPVIVGAVLLVFVLPMSWIARGSAEDTVRLLLVALAMPIVLAVPVGIAASKPTFWSEDLAVPAFVAIRPLSAEDLVAVKVRVAAVSALLAWLMVLASLALWLSLWGNLSSPPRLAGQRMTGVAVLVVLTGMILTWRFLVSRLWSGLSGNRRLFEGSVMLTVVAAIAAIVLDASKLPGWLLGEPARFVPLGWIAAIAVVAKFAIAAYAWRGVAARYRRIYLLSWVGGTASLLALGLVACGAAEAYLPLDVDHMRGGVVLLALLAVPLARLGLAPSALSRNRHR